MGVESADVVDADVILEFLAGLSPFLEEVGAEPYLLEMSFMRVFGENLFDCYFSLWRPVNAQPNDAEAASAEKSYSFEVFGEPFSEFGVLISSEVGSDIEWVLIFVPFIDF